VRMVMDGDITHAPSCVAILKAATLLSRESPPQRVAIRY
jgi:hypothetical protein